LRRLGKIQKNLSGKLFKKAKRMGVDLVSEINLLLSPEFWEYWQNLNTGIFYYCFDCLNACPVGK